MNYNNNPDRPLSDKLQDHSRLVILTAADAVDARHTRHHDQITPCERRTHRREPQFRNLENLQG